MPQEPTGNRRRSSLLRSDGSTRGRVGMVELFFDLVFVFAITQLSHTLLATLGYPVRRFGAIERQRGMVSSRQ
jgi:low temperature requirement protein LtrA